MSPAIQLLLIQIMQLGALLAANPNYIVFTSTSGHVSTIEVRIYPAGSVWDKGQPRPVELAEARVRWEPYWSPYESGEEMYAARQLRCLHELEFMRAALHAYLPVDHTDITDLPEAA